MTVRAGGGMSDGATVQPYTWERRRPWVPGGPAVRARRLSVASSGKIPGENFPQFFRDHRLGEVVVATGSQAFLAVAHHGIGGQGHDGALPALLAKPAGGLEAIQFRHLDVHENQIVGPALGLRLLRHFAGRAAILRQVHFQIQPLRAGRPSGIGSRHRPPQTAPALARAAPASRARVLPDLVMVPEAADGDCSRGTPRSGPASIVRVKVLPRPNSLATSISPPRALARRWEMANPRPDPP